MEGEAVAGSRCKFISYKVILVISIFFAILI